MKKQFHSILERINQYLTDLVAVSREPALQPVRVERERPRARRGNSR